jgi:hypothetical protein
MARKVSDSSLVSCWPEPNSSGALCGTGSTVTITPPAVSAAQHGCAVFYFAVAPAACSMRSAARRLGRQRSIAHPRRQSAPRRDFFQGLAPTVFKSKEKLVRRDCRRLKTFSWSEDLPCNPADAPGHRALSTPQPTGMRACRPQRWMRARDHGNNPQVPVATKQAAVDTARRTRC